MPLLVIFLAYYYYTTVNSSIDPSIDPETLYDWSLFSDSSTVPVGSGGTNAFSFNVNTDQTAQGPPGYQGNLFSSSDSGKQGSLFASSSINSAVSDSGSTAFDGLGTQSVSLNLPSIVSGTDSIVPEDLRVFDVSSNIASNAPGTVATVPKDQGRPSEYPIVLPSTLETDKPESEDQGKLYLGSVIALSPSEEEAAVPEGQNNEVDSSGIPCYSKETGLICRPNNQLTKPRPQEPVEPDVDDEAARLRRIPPRKDRPARLVEPPERKFQSTEGKQQPWVQNYDGERKRCSIAKNTYCCDGPWSLPGYVANCFDCKFF
ncbi:hypothetical protein MMC07_005991 [Pseudocyphellaria aurata]|nr:hypothetical protein [Pseudocyphellaria aurata]